MAPKSVGRIDMSDENDLIVVEDEPAEAERFPMPDDHEHASDESASASEDPESAASIDAYTGEYDDAE